MYDDGDQLASLGRLKIEGQSAAHHRYSVPTSFGGDLTHKFSINLRDIRVSLRSSVRGCNSCENIVLAVDQILHDSWNL